MSGFFSIRDGPKRDKIQEICDFLRLARLLVNILGVRVIQNENLYYNFRNIIETCGFNYFPHSFSTRKSFQKNYTIFLWIWKNVFSLSFGSFASSFYDYLRKSWVLSAFTVVLCTNSAVFWSFWTKLKSPLRSFSRLQYILILRIVFRIFRTFSYLSTPRARVSSI